MIIYPHQQIFNIQILGMEKDLYNTFWTTKTTKFINSIFESSHKVLQGKVDIGTLQWHVWFLWAVEFFYYFYF